MKRRSKQSKSKYQQLARIAKDSHIPVEDLHKIPVNDLEAWQAYPRHNWVYNKLQLARFQNLKAAPMPIEPKSTDYPVIIRPITNLYGMGVNVKRVENQDEFYDEWHNTGFWTPIIDGRHFSYDVAILNGKIVWYTMFEGYPFKTILGAFTHWQTYTQKERQLPKAVTRLIRKHFKDFTGMINTECLENDRQRTIIECHLRMGDVHEFYDYRLMSAILHLYLNNNDNNSNSNNKGSTSWRLPDDYEPKKTFLIPIWSSVPVTPSDLISEEELETITQANPAVVAYTLDTGNGSNPPMLYRIANLIVRDYTEGLKVKDQITDFIRNKDILKA